MKRYGNRKLHISLFILLLLSIAIGYAALTSNLDIAGSTKITGNTWDIHFNNVQVTNGSVEATSPATISPTDNTKVNYSIELDLPGDFYEFTVDIVNAGTIPGVINLVSNTGIDSQYENIIEYSVKYTNGKNVLQNDLLNAGSTKTIKVRVYFKENIDNSDLPSSDINLNMVLSITYNQSSIIENNASNLLQNLSKTESCITKYEGQVTDRVGVTETATNVYFDKCENKRNVIFAGFCWQIVRSTETGGTKMIYNGEPVNGKCESTRGTHKGIVQVNTSILEFNSNYLYGDLFTYDTTNNTFTLVNTFTETWSDSTYENILGKFTCRSSSNTCTTIFQVNAYSSNTNAYYSSYSISDTNYAQVGKSAYNSIEDSLGMAGYMFNKHYYKNSFGYSEYPSGNYAYGDSYTDNGNGTYTINNATLISSSEWSSNYIDVRYKYVCKNPTNNTCSNVWYVSYTTPYKINYFSSVNNFKYGNSFTYENGMYTLTDTDTFWNIKTNINSLNNRHYTCFNLSGTCSEIVYVYHTYSEYLVYIKLNNGESVEDALDKMLTGNDVNRYNSLIKGIVDSWYLTNLSSYTYDLEDTVHCNGRNITNLRGWDPNGGDSALYLAFKNYTLTANLVCPSETDQFSLANNKAKLAYPVALFSPEELYNLGESSNNLRITGEWYWTLSPRHFSSRLNGSCVINDGRICNDGSNNGSIISSNGVRVAISLKGDVIFSSGSGSETDPWIVE